MNGSRPGVLGRGLRVTRSSGLGWNSDGMIVRDRWALCTSRYFLSSWSAKFSAPTALSRRAPINALRVGLLRELFDSQSFNISRRQTSDSSRWALFILSVHLTLAQEQDLCHTTLMLHLKYLCVRYADPSWLAHRLYRLRKRDWKLLTWAIRLYWTMAAHSVLYM